MKKILLICLSVFLVGCTLSVEEEKSYLTEKQECFGYRDFANEELVYQDSVLISSSLETIFYSPVLDTCVAVVHTSLYIGEEIKEDVEYWDVLEVVKLDTFNVYYLGDDEFFRETVSKDLKRLREYREEIGVPFN